MMRNTCPPYVARPLRWRRVIKFSGPGICGWCGRALEGRRTAWCSSDCATASDRASGLYVRSDALRANRKANGGALRCSNCQRLLTNGPDGEESRPEVDHIVPLALGGDLVAPSNIQVLCRTCHKKKTALDAVAIADARQRARATKNVLELETFASAPRGSASVSRKPSNALRGGLPLDVGRGTVVSEAAPADAGGRQGGAS
jgi:5-methylcytosine-specific restriction endonuclease McrA